MKSLSKVIVLPCFLCFSDYSVIYPVNSLRDKDVIAFFDGLVHLFDDLISPSTTDTHENFLHF